MATDPKANERSQAIKLISKINGICSGGTGIIRSAGGELGIKSAESTLFPDVILFGDETGAKVLQGWELKMPDTPVTDAEFLADASRKARLLGTNSFVMWNMAIAVLYVFDEKGEPAEVRTWDSLKHLRTREAVASSQDEVEDQLRQILEDLEIMLRTGDIKAATIGDILTGEALRNAILQNQGLYSERIEQYKKSSLRFEEQLGLWWNTVGGEYPKRTKAEDVLAKRNLLALLIKFVFAHLIADEVHPAAMVREIDPECSLSEGLERFAQISADADFATVFNSEIAENLLPDLAWESFLELNELLKGVRWSQFDSSFGQDLLERLVSQTTKKTFGQFTTPINLAHLLARLTIKSLDSNVIDPCCGTGTIAKAAYKMLEGRTSEPPTHQIWASDKFDFPLQIATLNLSTVDNRNRVLQVFQHDALDLKSGQQIELKDPTSGEPVERPLPLFDAVISNLPFVAGKNMKNAQVDLTSLEATAARHGLAAGSPNFVPLVFSKRFDLYAVLPFSILNILKPEGRLGLVTSNSWLGAAFGEDFFSQLRRFFRVECILISGVDRWFENADVVASILILQRRETPLPTPPPETVTFAVLDAKLGDIHTSDKCAAVAGAVSGRLSSKGLVRIHNVEFAEDASLPKSGLPLSAHFTDLSWLEEASSRLLMASDLFFICRGSRRGKDEMFFPQPGEHQIEAEFLKPVVKNSKEITHLTAEASSVAFCCSYSQDELQNDGFTGTLAWIRRFELQSNGKGKPLPEVLAMPNHHWYELSPNETVDFACPLNPQDRLFIAGFKEPTFINQRLVGFKLRNRSQESELDAQLMLALLNTSVALFFIEATGFGRGLGALDLSKDRIEKYLRILNPGMLDKQAKERILSAFKPVLARPIGTIIEELDSEDRRVFDRVVLEEYGLESIFDPVRNSLHQLYKIRMAAKI